MWPVVLIAVVVLGVGLLARPVRASTFPKERKAIPRATWRGCEPPGDARPQPRFRCGTTVIDNSTGKDRSRRIAELEGTRDRAERWQWAYLFADGTGASERSVREAEGREQ